MADWLDAYPVVGGGGAAVAEAPANDWLAAYPTVEPDPADSPAVPFPNRAMAKGMVQQQVADQTKDWNWLEKNAYAVGTAMDAGLPFFRTMPTSNDSYDSADQDHWRAEAAAQAAGGGMVEKGIRSALSTLPTTLIAGRLGGPYGAIAAGAVQEADQSFTQGRDAGKTVPEAAGYALTQGVVEGAIAGAFQRFGLGGAEKLFGEGGRKAIARTVRQKAIEFAKQTGAELTEETLTGLSHSVAAQVAEVDPKALTSESLLDMVGTTAVATLATMGMAQGINSATQGQQRRERLGELRQERSAQQTADVFNKAAWSTPSYAESAVNHLIQNGLTADKIRDLAANPSSSAFEALGLGSRKNRTMPTAEARRAFGQNALKYLETIDGQKTPAASEEVPQGDQPAADDTGLADRSPQAVSSGIELGELSTPSPGSPAPGPITPSEAPSASRVELPNIDLFGQPVAPPRPTLPQAEAIPAPKQEALFDKRGKLGQMNAFDDVGVPDDMVVKNELLKEPVTVHHGSPRKGLTELLPSEAQQWGKAVYFASDPTYASGDHGQGGQLYTATILPGAKVFNSDSPPPRFFKDAEQTQAWQKRKAELVKKNDIQEGDLQPSIDDEWSENGKLAGEVLRELGYDAARNSHGDYGTEWAVFNPKAFKLIASQQAEVDDSPIGKTKSIKKIAQWQAAKWDMKPEEYIDFTNQVWEEKANYYGEIEAARKHALEQMGWNRKAKEKKRSVNDFIRAIDEKTDYTAIPNFDVTAETIANNFPALGWQHLVGESSSELSEKLWELLKNPPPKVPKNIDPEYHAAVDEYLNDLQSGPSFNPSDFETPPDYAFRMPDTATAQPATQDRYVRMSPDAPQVAMKMDAEGEPGVSAQGIVATLAKLFDIPIRSGRVQVRKALGIYDKRQHIVRTKGQSSADLAVISHEVAHHLDFTTDVWRNKQLTPTMRTELRNLDYEPQKKRAFEGFAEFVRLYMTDAPQVAKQAAPRFYDHFTLDWLPKHPEMARKIEQARGLTERYRNQGTDARIDSAISETGKPPADYRSLPEKLPGMVQEGWDRTVQVMKDRGHYYNLLDQAAIKAGYQLPDGKSLSGAMFAALDQGAIPRAERAIEDGVHLVTTSGKTLGPGLREIIAPVGKDYDDFRRFLIARHALEVYEKKNINPGIALEDAKWKVEQVAADPEKLQRYTKAAEGVTAFNHQLLEMVVDAGVIMPGTAETIRKSWDTYIPLFRAVEKGGGRFSRATFDPVDPVRRRHGSGKQILDPIESTMQQAIAFYQAALEKQVALQAIDESRSPGLGYMIEKVTPNQTITRVPLADVWQKVAERFNELGIADIVLDKESLMELGPEFADDYLNLYRPDYSPSDGEQIVRVVENGQPALYQFQKDMYDAMKSMGPVQIKGFLGILDKIAHGAASLTRLGATGLKSNFAAANLVRDWITYQVQSEHSRGMESLTDPLRWMGIYATSNVMNLAGRPEDPTVKLYNEMAGQLATSLGQDRKALRSYRQKILANSTKQKLRELMVHPINTLRDIVGVVEMGPRVAEFSNVLRANGFTRNKQGEIVNEETGEVERPPMDVLIEAINAANDVTVNFKRQGSAGRIINRYVPFFNAALEGNAKRFRVLRDTAGGKNWKRKAVAMASIASASLVYAVMRARDDDYKEEDDWLKWGYWTFTWNGTPIIRIPKPYEFSFIPNFIEAVVASVYEAKPGPAKDAAMAELERLVPPAMPAVVKPTLEVAMNHDIFRGKPIENQTLQRLRPGDRSTRQTTELMKAIGDFTNISPAMLEHWVDQTSAGLYGNVYGTTERLATGEATTADAPAIGAFTIKRDYGKSIDDFYGRKTELEQAAASAKADKAETADDVKAKQALQKFSDYAGVMTDLRKLIPENASRDDAFKVEKFIVGLARDALGEEPLNRYPNPLTRNLDALPQPVAGVVGKYRNTLANRASGR